MELARRIYSDLAHHVSQRLRAGPVNGRPLSASWPPGSQEPVLPSGAQAHRMAPFKLFIDPDRNVFRRAKLALTHN
jgi:hypothetical protein